MSFFRKVNRTAGHVFRKGIEQPIGNFFRKDGGLDQVSVGLRKGGNTFQQIGGGVRKFSTNPLMVTAVNTLGSSMGNPLLGEQMREQGMLVGDGMKFTGDVMKLGRDVTNRKNYNALERA